MRRRHRWGWGYEDAVIGAGEAAGAAEHLPITLGFAAQEIEEPAASFTLPAPRVSIPAPLAAFSDASDQVRAQHRLQLAGMPEAELPQQHPQGGGLFDPPHHQSRGDPIPGGSEGGVGHFGDLGVGDPRPGVGILHRARVAHRCPLVFGDGGDRPGDGPVLGEHQGELGLAAPTGTHHRAAAVGRIAGHQDLRAGPGSAGSSDRLGHHPPVYRFRVTR